MLQISFWMTRVDELKFFERLQSDQIVWTPYAIKYWSWPKKKNFIKWDFNAFPEKIILIPEGQWKQLRRERISDVIFDHSDVSIEDFKKWTMVGTGASPCCEFLPCGKDKEIISLGKLYLHTDYFDEKTDEMCVKPQESVRWFNRVTSWIRRQGRAGDNKGEFIMPDAAIKYDAGEVKLVESISQASLVLPPAV